MNAFSSNAIRAYASIGVETGVASASPHQLILMLYEGAISAVAAAQAHLHRNDMAAKGHAISKAISIVSDGLSAALQKNAGGQLAMNLSDLYQYMGQRLFQANLNNDLEAMEEVRQLLQKLKSAWETMPLPQASANAPVPSNQEMQQRTAAASYGSI